MYVISELSYQYVRVHSVDLFTLHKVQVIRLKSGSIPYFSRILRTYVFRLLELSS